MLNTCARFLLAGLAGCFVALNVGGLCLADVRMDGEAAFRQYCTECHSGGGNMIKPDKTLSKADREKNGVRTARDIIHLIRNPGEGMTTFDEKTVTEKEAQAIADYILTTFK